MRSDFVFCQIEGMRFHRSICQEKCNNIRCAFVRKRNRAAIEAKIEEEIKVMEDEGITRSLLLKPEDRVKENKK